MCQTAPNSPQSAHRPSVLVTGATGYVGGKLITLLEQQDVALKCLARHPAEVQFSSANSSVVIEGDLLDKDSLERALVGVTTAYYLVHSMSDAEDFAEQDRRAAENFADAARKCRVQRIIYLGGLGDDDDPNLSPHLRSRHEVGKTLRDSGVETIEFRASLIIGNGSLSYDLVKSLTERLPVMLCPQWLSTPTQPIGIKDLLEYLLAARNLPPGPSQIFEIGGSDVVTYGKIIQEYAAQKRLIRFLIPVPVLTPRLSSMWLALVTPATFKVGQHLIEGLKNPTLAHDRRALDVFPIRPMTLHNAIKESLSN